MRWIDRLNKSQRIVVVIAFGLAIATLGSFLVNIGSAASGWYAYSPLTNALYAPRGLHPWLRLIIWLVLIGVWALGSIGVLRASPGDASSPGQASDPGD
jgi:heme/copper-type cytochrome/quinol oxidase subunit 1